MTAAQYALLSAEEKKGIINVTDEAGNDITASDIIYDNTTSGLVADDAQSAIDEIDSKVNLINLKSGYFSHTTGTDKYYIGHNVDSNKAGQITIDTDGLHILNKNSGTWAEKYVLKPTKIISGNLPNNISSTAAGGNIDIVSVNEILDGYAVLSVAVYAYSQWRTITPNFQCYALVKDTTNNKTTIVGLDLLKAFASGYDGVECKFVLQKVN